MRRNRTSACIDTRCTWSIFIWYNLLLRPILGTWWLEGFEVGCFYLDLLIKPLQLSKLEHVYVVLERSAASCFHSIDYIDFILDVDLNYSFDVEESSSQPYFYFRLATSFLYTCIDMFPTMFVMGSFQRIVPLKCLASIYHSFCRRRVCSSIYIFSKLLSSRIFLALIWTQ